MPSPLVTVAALVDLVDRTHRYGGVFGSDDELWEQQKTTPFHAMQQARAEAVVGVVLDEVATHIEALLSDGRVIGNVELERRAQSAVLGVLAELRGAE